MRCIVYGFPLPRGMTVLPTRLWIHPSVKYWFTLTFDSSPIKGEGQLVGLSCCPPSTSPLDCGLTPQ